MKFFVACFLRMENILLLRCLISQLKYVLPVFSYNRLQILYANTFKAFLTLYGHKLPVLSFDISTDNTLLVSGSSDKNIKLWGMDFGDCHKSLFRHNVLEAIAISFHFNQDAITVVKFVPNTHYFFSGSKDFMIKYFDGDTV